MRSSHSLAAALSFGMMLGCGSPTDDAGTAPDSSFIEAFPSSSELGLQTDADASNSADSSTSDDVQNGASLANDILDDAASGDVESVTIGNLTCAVFRRTTDQAFLKLTACRLDQADVPTRRWAYRLEGSPIYTTLPVSEDPAASLAGEPNPVPPTVDMVTLAAGRGGKLEGEFVRAIAGVVLYNFDATHALFGQGPTGKVAIGYRMTPHLRRIRVVQLRHSHDGIAPGVTARTGYVRVPGVGGLFATTGLRDMLTAEGGSIAQGQDGILEAGHLRFAWNSAGHGRRVAWVCGGSLGQGNCMRGAKCYDASGTVTYDVDSQNITADITWDEVTCSPASIPIDSENSFVGDGSQDESLDVTEPGSLD